VHSTLAVSVTQIKIPPEEWKNRSLRHNEGDIKMALKHTGSVNVD